MSKTTNDGGPAFPHLHNTCQRVNESEMFPGMTLRDYFAAAALTGLLANPERYPGFYTPRTGTVASDLSQDAMRLADAMVAARGGWAHVISTPGGRHGFIRRNDLRAMIASGKATKGGAS